MLKIQKIAGRHSHNELDTQKLPNQTSHFFHCSVSLWQRLYVLLVEIFLTQNLNVEVRLRLPLRFARNHADNYGLLALGPKYRSQTGGSYLRKCLSLQSCRLR